MEDEATVVEEFTTEEESEEDKVAVAERRPSPRSKWNRMTMRSTSILLSRRPTMSRRLSLHPSKQPARRWHMLPTSST
jgi:hypothetical protein